MFSNRGRHIWGTCEDNMGYFFPCCHYQLQTNSVTVLNQCLGAQSSISHSSFEVSKGQWSQLAQTARAQVSACWTTLTRAALLHHPSSSSTNQLESLSRHDAHHGKARSQGQDGGHLKAWPQDWLPVISGLSYWQSKSILETQRKE